jgi:hypothetical protein
MLEFAPRSFSQNEGPSLKPERVPLGLISNSVPASRRRHAPDPVRPVFVHVEFDIGLASDPQDVTEYEHIIYRAMRQRETLFPKAQVQQTEVTSHDRDCLVDWMCRLHYKAQITTESLFRAVGILDRGMALTRMSQNRLHLIGAAAMLIASKIEDTVAMSVDDAVAIGQKEYSPQDLRKMEIQLVNLINFDVEFPTILFFLTIFLRLNGQTQEFMLLARYISELCLASSDFLGVKPSAIAATALVVARTLAGMEPWTEQLAMYTQFSFEEVRGYCKTVHGLLQTPEREESAFIRRKYASDPFCNVAKAPSHMLENFRMIC